MALKWKGSYPGGLQQHQLFQKLIERPIWRVKVRVYRISPINSLYANTYTFGSVN